MNEQREMFHKLPFPALSGGVLLKEKSLKYTVFQGFAMFCTLCYVVPPGIEPRS